MILVCCQRIDLVLDLVMNVGTVLVSVSLPLPPFHSTMARLQDILWGLGPADTQADAQDTQARLMNSENINLMILGKYSSLTIFHN